MAFWSASKTNWTPVAVADTTNFTDGGYHALQGGSGTQRNVVGEVMVGGLASAAAPTPIQITRSSTVGATSLTGALLTALDPASAALAAPPATFSASTTKPQRSATLQLLNLSFNAFGGIVRWVAAPGQELSILGNTASSGELSINCMTGGTPGLLSSHMIFEPK